MRELDKFIKKMARQTITDDLTDNAIAGMTWLQEFRFHCQGSYLPINFCGAVWTKTKRIVAEADIE